MSRRDVEEWFWQVGSELQRLNEEMVRSRPSIAPGRCWEPRIDLIEEEERYLLKADLAGVRVEDIGLLYLPDRHSILLRGVRPERDFTSEGHVAVHQLEIMYGEFQREIALPDTPIESDGIRAQYRNGFLLVMIPKLGTLRSIDDKRFEWQK